MSETPKNAEILSRYGQDRDNLMPILHEINNTRGHISEQDMQEIACHLNISATDVYGTATFYSYLNTEPKGKYVIRLCKSLSCDMAGKEVIAAALEAAAGCAFGKTSADNRFTLEYGNCMGWCDKGPAMLINHDVHTQLTPDKAKEILSQLK